MKASGAERGPDLEGLRAFVREGDRNRARFFVGREAQILDIEQVCADAFAGFLAGRPLAGATRLIQGAPGAGKTALLSQVVATVDSAETKGPSRWRRFFRKAGEGNRQPKAMFVDTGDLGDPARLALRIAEWLGPGKAKKLRQTHSRSIGAQAGAGGFGVGRGDTVATGPPQAGFAEIGALFSPEEWPGPLCLMVDEIQTLQAEQAPVLQSLHLATQGLPIVPVLAGLANSREVLARRGISRLNEDGVHTLGRLETGQPAQAVRAMLNCFRIESTEAAVQHWAVCLEEHSGGWPQHLQNAMRSLAEALLETNGALVGVDEAAVSARSLERRLDAYRARRSPQMAEAVFLLASVMAAIPEGGLRLHEVVAVVDDRVRRGGGSGWRLPETMSAPDFLDHLVHRGALQPGEDDRLACPIPSFRRFLIEEGVRAFTDDYYDGYPAGDCPDPELIALSDEMMLALEEDSGQQSLQ